MMLLAAVVLVVAFLALSVMVGRIATIEPQTLRDSDQPLLAEAETVRRGACAIFEITTGASEADDTGTAFAFLALQLAGRGYFATFTRDPLDVTGVGVTLVHGPSIVRFDVLHDPTSSLSNC